MGGAQTKSVTLRLDLSVNGRLDGYCRDAGLSKSLVVNCALADFLGANEKARVGIIKDYIKRAKRKS
jgi:predicted transcriptional regulator